MRGVLTVSYVKAACALTVRLHRHSERKTVMTVREPKEAECVRNTVRQRFICTVMQKRQH